MIAGCKITNHRTIGIMTEETNDTQCSTLGDEIVKSFHEQFAQNQNHHQKLFLQVLAVLLTVLVGFGYLYIRVDVKQNDINVTLETIYAYLAVSMFLLSLAIALILNMSLGFRRDQLVACNIRVKIGVMKVDDKNTDCYFPSNFNPVGKTNFITWMPEFHQIFFSALIIFKILIIGSLYFNSNMSVSFNIKAPNTLITVSLTCSLLSFILDFFIAFWYLRKWKKFSDDAPSRLKHEICISELII
jgi:hypothetical protein